MPEPSKKSAPRFSADARRRVSEALAKLAPRPDGRILAHPEHTGPWPLTEGQQRLWIAEELLGKTPLYHVPLAAHLVGNLDVPALEHSLTALVCRHDVLRARFLREDERVLQLRLEPFGLPLVPVDLTAIERSRRRDHALELARAEFRRPFDLAQGPPIRAALWRLAEDEHLLLLSLHHIVCDGATMDILCGELGELYAARREGRSARLSAPALQHGDYALWERERRDTPEVRAAVEACAERLRAPGSPLDLPGDRQRPPRWTVTGGWRTRRMDAALAASLEELARAHQATPFQLFLAAFHALLLRMTGQEDQVVGIPVGLRAATELERLPGFLVNTLALRTEVPRSASFVELLARVKATTLEALANRAAPFGRVLERVGLAHDPARSPLFQVMFDHRASAATELQLAGLESGRLLREDELHSGTSKVDLALYSELAPDGLAVSAEFRSELFDPATIDRWLERFEVLLRGIAGNPHAHLDQLALLGVHERELLACWAHGPEVTGCDTTVPAVVAGWAERSPDKVALEHENERTTYAELARRVHQLARHLLSLGVQRGEPVALCLARTAELAVAELAILEAGGAYLPLDPNYPPERLRFMLEDSGARVLVSEAALAPGLPHERLRTVLVDRDRAAIAAHAPSLLAPVAGPDDPAYLIYTSGSTGRPKGVACPHRGVLRLFREAQWLDFDARVRMVHLAPESFDASVLDLLGPLLAGGTVVLHPERTPTLAGLARVVAAHDIDTLFLTTALFHAIVEEMPEILARLRQIATGGEALSLAHLRRARELCPELHLSNCYGPTEATVIATAWVAPLAIPPDLASVPIGSPVANTTVLVLDEALQPVPVGVPGEVLVGGPSIALGYWKRPELTTERFVADPRGAGRLYRTGDLARWRADGTLEYLGRRDDQVKIRGHRIELGEVEAALGAHRGVQRALVIAREDQPGVKQLVAYVVPGDVPPTPDELSAHLATRLPEYMRPSACVLLDELPITPGGKVDRARLPAPGTQAGPARREPPRGATEELLAGLWSELLGVAEVGRQDDFFALGGHSLAATILIARVHKHLGAELPLALVFHERTLAALARAVDAARDQGARTEEPIVRTQENGPAPLSFNQRGLWFLQRLAPGSAAYNVPFALPLRGALDAAALERSLEEIQQRHEVLRTRFPVVDGAPVQVPEARGATLATLDLRARAPGERSGAAAAAMAAFAREPFDIAAEPLFRALLVRTADDQATLAVNVHHIVFDGWSFELFVSELAELYGAFARAERSPLAPLALQYADHARWQARHFDEALLARELEFWKQELDGAPLVLELSGDRPRPAQPSWRGARVQRALPLALVQRLCALARAEGATPYLVLLTLAEALLARYAGTEQLVLGTPVAARTRDEWARSIGLYLNVLAIRADLSGDPSFRELLARTRERVLRAHAHQDLPFEQVVVALVERRDPAVTPVYQVLFSLRRASHEVRAAELVLEPALELDTGTAKTDLAITVEERAGDWLLDFVFATDLFDAATMERLGEHFETLLSSALAEPSRPLSELELLPAAERRRLVDEWSGASPDYPREESVAELFQRVVARAPEAVAVVHGDGALTYAELNARANRLAHHLIALGVERESRVAVCVERSPAMVVAVLAILKAGGAYVPLDPSYPRERLALMLEDSGAAVLLADERLVDVLPPTPARRVLLGSLEELARLSAEDPPARARGGDLAYVMYTSGSTGRPKGVEILQRSISRLVFSSDYATFDATRTWLQLAPLSFDASTLELFGALLHGARLVLYPERVPTAERLERVLVEQRVTSLWLTAALFNAIVDERPGALGQVAECLTGGEALSVAHVRRAYAASPASLQLVNGYGPTENTTFTCCYRIPRDLAPDVSSVPIGQPIANTRVYVVDRNLRPVPVGVAGELVTGGDGLARGYLGRPELNAERFVANPFGPGLLYRSGDRVRWLADGRLEFLGRTDDQVKIRGHRIEPGEIAVVLAGHARVRKAFVAVLDSPTAGKQLVAYLETQGGSPPTTEELSGWLAERLPAYMLPAAFVPMESLPMNLNGKVDRKRLPEPNFEGRSASRPRNEMENLLATLWQEVLGVENVGPEDDFFELGGHSLLAVKLVQAIHDAFGQELELSSLVSAPTLAEQARLLHLGIGGQRSSALVKLQPAGTETPIFCVCSLGGTVLNQRPLALRLGADRPFYGLQAIDLEALLGRPAEIADYARAYIEAMKKVAPRGPYVVGGHSFGGIVSFEIAQQLTGQGDDVAMLFILDSSLPNLEKSALDHMACALAFVRGLPYLPAEAIRQLRRDPEQVARALRQKLRFVAGKAGTEPRRRTETGAVPAAPAPANVAAGTGVGEDPVRMHIADIVEMSHWPENNRRIAERHWRAVLGYRPKAYPGRITLFRSRFQSPFLGLGSRMGWDRVALGGVEVVRVPGGHLSVLQPPNVDVLAKRLLECLARKRRAA